MRAFLNSGGSLLRLPASRTTEDCQRMHDTPSYRADCRERALLAFNLFSARCIPAQKGRRVGGATARVSSPALDHFTCQSCSSADEATLQRAAAICQRSPNLHPNLHLVHMHTCGQSHSSELVVATIGRRRSTNISPNFDYLTCSLESSSVIAVSESKVLARLLAIERSAVKQRSPVASMLLAKMLI